jgi:site-specific recombinase XerD
VKGVRKLLADYMNYLQEKGVSKNTITAYINDLKAFLDDLGIAPDDFVTSTYIRKWINDMLNPTDMNH